MHARTAHVKVLRRRGPGYDARSKTCLSGRAWMGSWMNQLDRLYQLERLLLSRRSLGRDALIGELEISRATLKRFLALLRECMNVPVVYDRDTNTYSINAANDKAQPGGRRQELPGKRFRAVVEAALRRAAGFPLSGKPGGAGTQKILLRDFPVAIVYIPFERQVVEFAIAHLSRPPGYWAGRINTDRP